MIKLNNSGPARFMYTVIAICLVTSITCFTMFYGSKSRRKTSTIYWNCNFYNNVPLLGKNYHGKCFKVI